MLRLATFGGLVLTDPAGQAVIPQRRRLALLALLAVGDERGVTRDKLLGYLWAESSSENARHAMEQLVYSMRKQVPDPLFQGVDPLRLNAQVVQADVSEFDRAIAAGEVARAVAIYRGPFLDGFYLAGAPEFERWVEGERTRLAEAHGQALRKLASEAHTLGRHTAEIDLRRRIASADPLEERAIVGLVRALVDAGDYVGAMRQAREYEARLKEEEPGALAADVVGLVQRLRGERPSRPTPAAPAAGDGGDAYTIEREVGRGTVATVYLARDRKHGRDVALKVLKPEVAAGSDRRRFEREIRILARLHHPHILPLYDSGVLALSDGREGLFYVMPYVEGETLRQRLDREGQLPVGEAVYLAREIADALAYAHDHGVVHRDVRPENILLQSGHALVADFGIARALEASAGDQVSTVGLVLGHPAYMSPEQARGTPELDARSDIYSLGCVLYEMLAGSPPFSGATRGALLARQMTDAAPSLRTVRAEVWAALERTVMRALGKRPADRFATASDFAKALGAASGE